MSDSQSPPFIANQSGNILSTRLGSAALPPLDAFFYITNSALCIENDFGPGQRIPAGQTVFHSTHPGGVGGGVGPQSGWELVVEKNVLLAGFPPPGSPSWRNSREPAQDTPAGVGSGGLLSGRSAGAGGGGGLVAGGRLASPGACMP